jgi:hypothetical protein
VGPGHTFGTVECYDPATDSWSVLPSLPTPRSGAGAAALDGALYVVGGYDRDGKFSAALEMLRL